MAKQLINPEQVVSVQISYKQVNSKYVYVPEKKWLGMIIRNECFIYTPCHLECSVEDMKLDYIIEDNIVYNKPTISFKMRDKSNYNMEFNKDAELDGFYAKIEKSLPPLIDISIK